MIIFQITTEPDSDIESDVCDSKATINESDNFLRMKVKTLAKTTKLSKNKNRKSNRCERGRQISSDEFNHNLDEVDMTMEEHSVNMQANQFSIEPEKAHVSDNEDKFGAMVSSKLLLMSPLQRLMSEKIITEILFKGQLGMLKRSLSPVLVADYMKNISNKVTTIDGSNDTDDDSDDCDPLMFQLKPEKISDSNLETFEFVKDEIAWSDDD